MFFHDYPYFPRNVVDAIIAASQASNFVWVQLRDLRLGPEAPDIPEDFENILTSLTWDIPRRFSTFAGWQMC